MDGEAIQKILDAGAEGVGRVLSIEGVDGAVEIGVLPKGDGRFEFVSLKHLIDEWRGQPERRVGTARTVTLQSFIALVNRHKDAGSAIFADTLSKSPSLQAVVDYHALDNAPRFGKHRIIYTFPLSPEWQAWSAQDGKAMAQGDFAAFIEERVADLAAPSEDEQFQAESLFQTTIAPPSYVMTLSKGLKITVEAKVKGFVNLTSGETEVGFEEVHSDGSGKKMKLPGMFVVNVPMFVGAEPSRILARLRYRHAGDKIVWWYSLYRADLALLARLRADIEIVGTETALPVFEGSPET